MREKSAEILEHKLSHLTGKTYPVGIEQFLLQRAENQGIAKGEKRGEKRGDDNRLKDVIRNSRENGLSIEVIAKIVQLSTEKVRQILDKE